MSKKTKQKQKYYDGTKLLSMKDINGNTPEIYLCTSNRTGGKTVYWNRWAVNRFLGKGKKFMLIYRYKYELDSVADKFFKDIQGLFFSKYAMRSERRASGIFHELFLCDNIECDELEDDPGVPCGYAVSLNSADNLKKYSHFFSDVDCMIFDEFQSETNDYVPNEIKKLLSIHTSVARGQGEQVRRLPLIMISNPVSIINPYYVELGISSRLRTDTKFLKGDGFVLEQGFNESASLAQKESAFNRAFAGNEYVAYSAEAVYLNDSSAFIEKPTGKSTYIATLCYQGKEYGIRTFEEMGIVYCDNRPDKDYYRRIAVTTEDHQINYVMLKSNDIFLSVLRDYFNHGCFRFKDLKCKEVILTALCY